jgi:hypothetical protein
MMVLSGSYGSLESRWDSMRQTDEIILPAINVPALIENKAFFFKQMGIKKTTIPTPTDANHPRLSSCKRTRQVLHY